MAVVRRSKFVTTTEYTYDKEGRTTQVIETVEEYIYDNDEVNEEKDVDDESSEILKKLDFDISNVKVAKGVPPKEDNEGVYMLPPDHKGPTATYELKCEAEVEKGLKSNKPL